MSLKDDHINDLRIRYPNVPEHALPKKKFTDKNANGLTAMILEWCRLHKVWANRISSEGRYRPGDEITDVIGQRRQMKGLWLPGMNKGLPDVITCVSGRFIGLEIKIGKDRQSQDQKDMQAGIEASEGVYLIIKTYEQFQKDFVETYCRQTNLSRSRKRGNG